MKSNIDDDNIYYVTNIVNHQGKSMSSKKSSLIKSVANRTVLLPVNLVLNKGVKNYGGVLNSALNSDKKITCPRCTQGYFFLHQQKNNQQDDFNDVVVEQNNHQGFVWECSHCALMFKTATKNTKQVMQIVENNSLAWYQEGLDNNLHPNLEQDNDKAAQYCMKKAYVFYFFTLVCLLFLPYLMVHASVLTSLNLVLMMLFLTLNGLKNAFQAWKFHNNLLFQENTKQLFFIWFKKFEIFKVWDYQGE